MASMGKSSQIQCRRCGGLGHFAHDCASSRVIALEDGGYDSASDYDEDTLALIAYDEQCAAAPMEQDSEYMAAEHAAKYPSLAAQRVLIGQITKAEPDQCHNLFHTKGMVKDHSICIIIDGGSCNNLASMEMVEKLSLMTRPHPRPYHIQWFNNSGKVKVTRTVCVHFTIAAYANYAECDVVPMQDVLFYLVDHGNLIQILYTMVAQISILLFIMIRKLCYFPCLLKVF
jgi:hypothetical protein